MRFSDITLRRNLDVKENGPGPRYFLEVDLSPVLPRPVSSSLPVYWRPNPEPHPLLKELYWLELAGSRLEKGSLSALQSALPRALAGMTNFGTLPYYYFSWPGGEQCPAYHSEGKLRLKWNGAGITGDDAGEVWQRLAESLLARRQISTEQELEVSLLLWRDMRLCPLAFAFQAPRVWLPIFYTPDANEPELIYDLIGLPSHFLGMREVFSLRRRIASSLVSSRAISTPSELGMTRLRQEMWPRLTALAKGTGQTLTYSAAGARRELPVFEAQGVFFAAQVENWGRVFFAHSPEELQRWVEAELKKECRLTADALRI